MKNQRYIHGLHEPGGEKLLMGDFPGWILFTHKLGDDPTHNTGFDYSWWTEQGYTIIARLNFGYGSEGTIPVCLRYARFASRCARFVDNSHGCNIWIVGNEPNHSQERPLGIAITPRMYADCYTKVWRAIKGLATHELQQVIPAPVAPWNNETRYPGNENGDWVNYFTDMLLLISMRIDDLPDGIALHTYTHGHDSKLITDESTMNAPFQDRKYNFRCYQDFMDAIPGDLRHVPVYITETDPDVPWLNENNGWMLAAYEEIDRWNKTGAQHILALIMYRWPKYDKWHIDGKIILHRDFRAAVQRRFTAQQKEPEDLTGYFIVVPDGSTDRSSIRFCRQIPGETEPKCKEFPVPDLDVEEATQFVKWLNDLWKEEIKR